MKLRDNQKLLFKKNWDGVYDDKLFMDINEEIKDEIVAKQTQISESLWISLILILNALSPSILLTILPKPGEPPI